LTNNSLALSEEWAQTSDSLIMRLLQNSLIGFIFVNDLLINSRYSNVFEEITLIDHDLSQNLAQILAWIFVVKNDEWPRRLHILRFTKKDLTFSEF